MRQFIADNWPVRLWFWIVPLAAPLAAWWYAAPLPWLLGHWLNVVLFAGILALAWVTGWLAAIIPCWFIFGPIYFGQARDNGAPYRIGDQVRVLVTGRHRGQVARVRDVWECRGQVRLDLGEEAAKRWEDVFSDYEVYRIVPDET